MHLRKRILSKIYNNISEVRKKIGDFKKCEFHIHTPESSCYNLINSSLDEKEENDEEKNGFYKSMSINEVLDYAKECGYLQKNQYDKLVDNLEEYETVEYRDSLKERNIPFKDFKEYITYMLIAYKLYKEDIDVAVISDHNTIRGFYKLKYAIKEYYDRANWNNNRKRLIHLFLGVEISCSDKNHLVIIGEESRYEYLQSYLDKIIMGETLGSHYNTSNIIDELYGQNFVMYIAHSQSSDLHGNAAYNRYLFKSKGLMALGLTNKNKREQMIDKIKGYADYTERLGFVYEGDSHSINEIGIKNTWVKFQKINFSSLIRAFKNHEVCIYINEPSKASKYIKGIAIDTGESGFLGNIIDKHNSHENLLVVPFSSDLNCIIGGKGTGKSTVLNIIDIIYSQKTDNFKLLKFISAHKRIFSVFVIDGDEYILEFIPQVKKKMYEKHISIYEDSYLKNEDFYILREQWYNVYKVVSKNKKIDFKDIEKTDIKNLLSKVFKRGYSINKLVEKIDTGDIKNYIKNIITYGVKYNALNLYIKDIKLTSDYRFISNLKKKLPEIIIELDRRKVHIDKAIDILNKNNDKSLLLEYREMDIDISYMESFLKMFNSNKNILNTALRWQDLQPFFIEVISEIGFLKFLLLLFEEDYKEIENVRSIKNYKNSTWTIGSVQAGIDDISKKNIKAIYKEILNRIRPKKQSIDSKDKRRELLEDSIITG
ncbi:MAG: hypothetical protein RSD47_11170 [Romboutsia sp.]